MEQKVDDPRAGAAIQQPVKELPRLRPNARKRRDGGEKRIEQSRPHRSGLKGAAFNLNPPDKRLPPLYIERQPHRFRTGGRCRLRKGVRRARISIVQRRS